MNCTNDILHAIEGFIRKYYKSRIIRGSLWTVGIVVAVFLVVVAVEHWGWLPSVGRGLLFWSSVAVLTACVGLLIVLPWAKMKGIARHRMNRAEAARIIGHHFPEVSDRLLNLLQLIDTQQTEASEEDSLLLAAIEQKSAELHPVPMLQAVNLRDNLKYLKYALPPLAVLLLLLIFWPHAVAEPTRRIVNYQTFYERPAPFRFVVLNENLSAMRGDDFELLITTEGEAHPADVQLLIDGRSYTMQKLHRSQFTQDTFTYRFRHLSRSQSFSLEGGGVSSTNYELQVLPVPAVVSFTLRLSYPSYTGRHADTLVGIGDAAVPEGTVATWHFQTRDADSLRFAVDSAEGILYGVGASGRATVQQRVSHSLDYSFCVMHRQELRAQSWLLNASDTLHYTLTAIPDAAPMIEVEEVIDSLHPDRRLFRGTVKDDYGFSRLVFRHTLADSTAEEDIALQEGLSAQPFYFSFNIAELDLRPGNDLQYYFEVYDNDAIHGPKSTRSRAFEIRIPSEEELDEQLSANSTQAQEQAQMSVSELQQLQEEINTLMQRLVDKKELDWQDRKTLEELARKQEQVRSQLQQVRSQLQENARIEQKYRQQSEQLMEKQRELERLMNEVMDAQMKQTMAEIEKMMKQLDKQKVQEELDRLKTDNAELERQLDQNIELMKRLELEKRVEQTVQKMDKLADEQRTLSQQTENSNKSDREQLQQKQQELNEQYHQLQQELKEIQDQYKEMGDDFKVSQQLQQQVEEEQRSATDKLRKGDNKDASDLQQQAADDMEKLAEAIAEAQVDVEQQSLAEDAEMIRHLLKDLITLSFNQEGLIADVNAVQIQDPKYQEIIAGQNRVREDFRMVQDSLQGIARRQVQVASAITRDVAQVNSNISLSLNGLLNMNQSFYGNYRNTQSARPMQYSMTSLNNLALVLAESLDQMQNQMRQNMQKKGSGQCKNPGSGNNPAKQSGKGKGKMSAKSMKQMQEELNKQMEALKKQLDQQGQQGGQRHQIGQSQQMSEELARMAAEQEQIRRMMQQYGQELKEANGGDKKLAREIDQLLRQMEQTEQDLVNRTITRQTLQRQQQIMTRLLEHEHAEMQREREQRRESREGHELYSQPSPAELERYLRQAAPTADQLRTLPPQFTPFYRQKAQDYLAQ